MFDDSRLDDPEVLAAADGVLRPLAEAGARLRREAEGAASVLARLAPEDRPRAVIAVGPEARLLRAVSEPVCPVPVVAWPNLGLPGWVGPLDIVVVLGGAGIQPYDCVHEALRRGSRVLLTAHPDSDLAARAESRHTTLLPSATTDPLCRAAVALAALHRLGLVAPVEMDAAADRLDAVAAASSHSLDVTENPAKRLALELADSKPLVWGGSVLAARASRRVAAALRAASGRIALSADAADLTGLLTDAAPRDLFSDPFETDGAEPRPALLVLEDGLGDPASDEARELLRQTAEAREVRVSTIEHTQGSELVRYVSLLAQGKFAAAYLAIGSGRTPEL